MSAIKRKLAIFLILFAAGAFLTVWFAVHAIPLGAIVFGTACIGALFFLYKNFVSLQEARLICENAILTVPSAILSCPKGNGSEAVTEAVVSPFGVLVNGRTIGWGKDGRDGIKLQDVIVDPLCITLFFGDRNKQSWIKLPHGLVDEAAMCEVQKRLYYETGVEVKMHLEGRKAEAL